jgi:3-isopropylmalate dehydratase small subunit
MLKGKAHKFGADIDTDRIIPARHMVTSDPAELAKHCMEDADPAFAGRVKPGDVMVAGKNFGCGSSREHAPVSIKGTGISCVIAKSFARIFYRNAFNMGLPILESAEASEGIEGGHEVEVELDTGVIRNRTTGKTFEARPVPPFMQQLLRDGGLMAHLAKRIAAR